MKCPNCFIELRAVPGTNKLQCFRCVFNVVPNVKIISEIYAWVSVDKNGYEGIIGLPMPGYPGGVMAAVNSNRETLERMEPIMRKVLKTGHHTLRLIRLHGREIVKEIKE